MQGKKDLITSISTDSSLGNNQSDCQSNEEQRFNKKRTHSLKNMLLKNYTVEPGASPHYHKATLARGSEQQNEIFEEKLFYDISNSVVILNSCGQINELENLVCHPSSTGNKEFQLSYVFGSADGKQNRYAHLYNIEELDIPGLYNTSVLNENIAMVCDNKF